MVDGHGVEILNDLRTGLTCDSRVGQEKFAVNYGTESCGGSAAPRGRSNGVVEVTATTEDGELVVSRTLKCNK